METKHHEWTDDVRRELSEFQRDANDGQLEHLLQLALVVGHQRASYLHQQVDEANAFDHQLEVDYPLLWRMYRQPLHTIRMSNSQLYLLPETTDNPEFLQWQRNSDLGRMLGYICPNEFSAVGVVREGVLEESLVPSLLGKPPPRLSRKLDYVYVYERPGTRTSATNYVLEEHFDSATPDPHPSHRVLLMRENCYKDERWQDKVRRQQQLCRQWQQYLQQEGWHGRLQCGPGPEDIHNFVVDSQTDRVVRL